MTGTIQMLKPAPNSPEYYVSFYNMYNLLQINDATIFSVFEDVKEHFQLTNEDLLKNISTDNYAERLNSSFIATGIKPPDNVVKMMSEDRGVDTSFVQQLLTNSKDTFDWFRKTNEFSNLYSIFEQSLKEYLLQEGYSKNVKPSESIDILLKWLDGKSITTRFLGILEFKTYGLVSSASETRSIWDYYTKIRNCFSHSGGRVTKKVKDGFNVIKSKHSLTLSCIQDKDYLSHYFLATKDEDFNMFFCNYALNDIIQLDNSLINFFRMFCVYLVETLAEL